MNTNNIVIWVILPNNADWDCFKIPILREILKIRNPLLEEHCAFLEVIHLFQQVGCARNKLQFRTVQQNQKSSSSTSSNLGRTWHGYQDPGKSVVEDDRSGKPDRLSPAGYSKVDYGRSWSSQEWKSEAAAHNRSGKPDETSWNAMQQVRPHHEEPLLDGNAQSVRYEEMLHDGSGKLDNVTYQEGAESKTFVMGSDAAEFVNKVKDQVRKRQKRMSNVADSGEEHSIIW